MSTIQLADMSKSGGEQAKQIVISALKKSVTSSHELRMGVSYYDQGYPKGHAR